MQVWLSRLAEILFRRSRDERLANEIEARWKDFWEEHHTFWTPNPSGVLADGFDVVRDRTRLYVLDMFPYPSGAGLHVGPPLGYLGTDVRAIERSGATTSAASSWTFAPAKSTSSWARR